MCVCVCGCGCVSVYVCIAVCVLVCVVGGCVYRVFVRKLLFLYSILVTRKYLNTKKIIGFRVNNTGPLGISTVFFNK